MDCDQFSFRTFWKQVFWCPPHELYSANGRVVLTDVETKCTLLCRDRWNDVRRSTATILQFHSMKKTIQLSDPPVGLHGGAKPLCLLQDVNLMSVIIRTTVLYASLEFLCRILDGIKISFYFCTCIEYNYVENKQACCCRRLRPSCSATGVRVGAASFRFW